MPYIDPSRRTLIAGGAILPETCGELNFLFTITAEVYRKKHGTSYQTFNDIMGAFDNAAKEYYRRVVAPYEDEKILSNGDVYE